MQVRDTPIRIIIVDDQQRSRGAIRGALERASDLLVIGCVSNWQEVMKWSGSDAPQVMIMRLRSPSADCIEAVRVGKRAFHQVKMLLIAPFEEPQFAFQAIEAGSDGYVFAGIEDTKLRDVIRLMATGMKVFDEHAVDFADRGGHELAMDEAVAQTDLSRRDLQIIHMIMEGLSNREIAQRLQLREGTTKNLVSLLLSKTDTSSRTQLVKFALDRDLISV